MLTHYLKVSQLSSVQDKTVLNVTHKLDAIADCDRAVLIEAGRVAMIGNVEDVI